MLKYREDHYSGLVNNNVTKLCKSLRTLKNASQLRKHDLQCALVRNDTRWGSIFNMLERFLDISTDLFRCNFGDEVNELIRNAVTTVKLERLAAD